MFWVCECETQTKYCTFSMPLLPSSALPPQTPFARRTPASRATAIDCGMLAALDAKEGPPKRYMVEEAVQKKQAHRLAECSFKTRLETGKFKPGCLSEKVKHDT